MYTFTVLQHLYCKNAQKYHDGTIQHLTFVVLSALLHRPYNQPSQLFWPCFLQRILRFLWPIYQKIEYGVWISNQHEMYLANNLNLYFRRNIYLKQAFNFRWRWFEFGVKTFWIVPFQSCCSVCKYWNHAQQPRMDWLPRATNPIPKLFCSHVHIICYIYIHINKYLLHIFV